MNNNRPSQNNRKPLGVPFRAALGAVVLLGAAAGFNQFQLIVHAQSSNTTAPGSAPGIHVVSPLPNGQWTFLRAIMQARASVR